jgi:hypothetical protein
MKKIILITLIFIFFTILFTSPAVLHLSDKIIGDGCDNSVHFAMQYVTKTQIEKGGFPFSWTNYWRYPVGFDFSISYDGLLFYLLGLFFYIFLSNPMLVYNFSVLILVFSNGIFSYLFFKKISRSDLIGIFGAVMFGFSFYVLARLGGHMNLIFTGSFPFFAYSLILLKERRGDTRSFIIFTSSVILTFLASLQYIFILVAGIFLIMPIAIIFYSRISISFFKIFWDNKLKSIISLLCISILFTFINIGHIKILLAGNLTTLPLGYVTYLSPYLTDFLQPGNYVHLLISRFEPLSIGIGGIEGAVFMGYAELVIFIVLLLISKTTKRFKLFILFGTLVTLITTLGCKNPYYPYCYLFRFFPFKGVAEVSRFYIIFYLLLTTGVVYFISRLKRKLKTTVTIIIFALITFERIPDGFYLSDTPRNEQFINAAKSTDSKAILDLPIINQWQSGRQKVYYDLYSVYYQKPIVNGYIHWLGDTPSSESFLNKFDYLACGKYEDLNDPKISEKMKQILVTNNITAIVLHKTATVDNEDVCMTAYKNIDFFLYRSNIDPKTIYNDNETTVFQLQ